MGNGPTDIQGYWELAIFQTNIASNWAARAKRYSDDPIARFFFEFTALNALYFLWNQYWRDQGDYPTEQDPADPSKRRPKHNANEGEQISFMLRQMSPADAQSVLGNAHAAIEYFGTQRGPVLRMDKRDSGQADLGDDRDGKKRQKQLVNARGGAGEQMGALGQIVYLVRSNLVHGSKSESGDDANVIGKAGTALSAILEACLPMTKQFFQVSDPSGPGDEDEEQ